MVLARERTLLKKKPEKAIGGCSLQGTKLKCVTSDGCRSIRCTVMGQNYLLKETGACVKTVALNFIIH